MDVTHPHWILPADLEEAEKAQREMAEKISLKDSEKPIEKIAGMDVSNHRFDPQKMIYGSVTLLSYPPLTRLETASQKDRQTFPYIPGFLGFREVPVLMQAYGQLSERPDLIMVDGHGVSHPRGLGVASHVGVLLDLPTIGVAKSILVGKPAGPLGLEEGSQVPLVWKEREIGTLLRTKKNCRPLIISAGHKISLNTAIAWVQRCLKGYRLPETTRHAHLAANRYRRSFLELCV